MAQHSTLSYDALFAGCGQPGEPAQAHQAGEPR